MPDNTRDKNICCENTFPRGLFQPEGSFRFSADALLLGAFSMPQLKGTAPAWRIADLGAGCGVVGFYTLLGAPLCTVVGVEAQPVLVEAALCNARSLGVMDRYSCLCADVEDAFHSVPQPASQSVPGAVSLNRAACALPGSFDLVVANPPYRVLGKGRLPANPARVAALFGTEKTLCAFCAAAWRALRPKGILNIVFAAPRLAELLETLGAVGFGVCRVLPVYGTEGKDAGIVLVEAYKGCKTALRLASPLIVYKNGRLTPEALAFCPELACNSNWE